MLTAPFDNPDSDVVELHRGDDLDLAALFGNDIRHTAYVSISGTPAVKLRRRDTAWRCDAHGFANPPCRHIEDVALALEHLAHEGQEEGAR